MITSPANPRVKAIRKLRDRKERQATGLSYIEGLRLVVEAVQVQAELESILVAPELLTSEIGRQAAEQASQSGVEVIEVSAPVFRSFALKDDPQGIAAIIRQRWQELGAVDVLPGELWLALVEVADPGNLGTIMRTLEAVGGKGIILLDQSTDPYDLSALRASMGAVFSLKLVKTDLNRFKIWTGARQVHVVGADDEAEADYHHFRFPDKMVIMMGSERQGFLPQHTAACDQVVSIPMAGRCDSLNLAVATSVILYEVFNQRRKR